MRRLPTFLRTLAALALLGASVPPAFAGPLPEFDASANARPTREAAALSRSAAEQPALRSVARVQSTDERHGVPSFVWANRTPASSRAAASRVRPQRTADQAARAHLSGLAPLYRLGRGDVEGAKLRHVHDTGRGAVIASYRQEIGGIEVFLDEFRVCMSRDFELVSVSGYLPARRAAPADAQAVFRVSGARAVALALRDYAELTAEPADVFATGTAEGGYETFAAPAVMRGRTDGRAVEGGLRARKVWFHVADALEPAWYTEVMGETAAYAYVFSARDGRLLFRHSIMQDVAFSYRLWANTTSPFNPMDGPQGDGASPHPTGTPNLYMPALIAPNLVTLQNGPISTNDAWLAPGATETVGNNADAYVDLVAPDGFGAGDFRATTTSPGVFDRTYDVNLAPGSSAAQRMASVTSLFYLNNHLHDTFYDAGFDEASGNAQADNYGRGGAGGDRIRAEGQDYAGVNNANMATPADGASPRMQMYVFNAPASTSLTVSSPGGIAGTYATGPAQFGPQNFTLAGQVVAGQDGVAPIDDGCSAITSPVAGKIALIDRGICGFTTKVQNAQNAGAIGVLIVNSIAGPAPSLGGSSATITIPTLSLSQADGALIRAQLGAGVNVTMNRPVQLQRDGTIDGHIVAHEWGHYISNRLIGNAGGLSSLQGVGMGEGWGDFTALLMTMREADALAGVYNIGPYALSGNLVPDNSYYFGIRRYPYSTDMTKNPLTFKHIQDGQALPPGPPIDGDPSGATNSEVHNTGEVWCTMLWECYAALLGDSGRLTFAQARQRMTDYVVAGYKMTPNAPTFVEARDAILSAAYANDAADFALMAQAFAKRGLGTGAVAPDRDASGNIGAVESFALGGDLKILSVTLTDDLHSCDDDTYLDNNERGTLRVELANTGWTTLSATTVTVSSSHPGITFPSGNVFGPMVSNPFGSTELTFTVDLAGAQPRDLLQIAVDYDDPGLLSPGPITVSLFDVVHADESLATTDNIEAHGTTWSVDVQPGSAGDPWGRTQEGPTDHEFHIPDAGSYADHRLVTPPLQVSGGSPLVITLMHRYSFEAPDWDGGVIEITTNGGASWTDIGASASPGYTGILTNTSGNPLGGSPAWIGTSFDYPFMIPLTVNLGMTYAGQTVQVRFRHVADAGVGGPGWWIDDVAVSGITSPPFAVLADEVEFCGPLAVDDTRPTQVALAMAGDNPARGGARLRFALPIEQRVQLTVHDLAGRLVATLADGQYSPGWHDAAFSRMSDGTAPGAGVYFARLRVNGQQFTRRIILVR